MAARSIGTGTITFGLVTIPVKMFTTQEGSTDVSFNLIHQKCKGRLKQQYFCPKDNEIVERSAMVKGYEFAKDQYVLFTEEELKALDQQASKAVEILEFLPLEKVDPIYFEKAYYLGPEKGTEKSYKLLSLALRQTGRCALAKYASRGKQYLVLLRPLQDGLVMQELRYADEVKPFSDVAVEGAEVKELELKLAIQLIDQHASDEFHPEQYKDDVKERVLAQIQRKVEGHAITSVPEAPIGGEVVDLMEALKASLAKNSERKGPKRVSRKSSGEATTKRAK